jgi:hypothetical protein
VTVGSSYDHRRRSLRCDSSTADFAFLTADRCGSPACCLLPGMYMAVDVHARGTGTRATFEGISRSILPSQDRDSKLIYVFILCWLVGAFYLNFTQKC